MKKHYAFIPLNDADIIAFRKALLANLWFRPCFAFLAIILLGLLGYTYFSVFQAVPVCFVIYVISVAFVLYQLFLELNRLHIVNGVKKSNLLPFIHAVKGDAYFYSEEISCGFIIQIEPVSITDINTCKKILTDILSRFAESRPLFDYLSNCLNGSDKTLINKAVIYTEIIKDQLADGNLSILATHDKLVNYVAKKEGKS